MSDLPQDIEASSTAWQAVDPKKTTSHMWTPNSLWSRYRDDIFWIGIYLASNMLVFWLRFRQYPIDPCVAFAPAVAKGSAEVVMFNCTLTLLSVCHRVIDRLRLWVASPVTATSPLRQRPLEMHREFHVLTGTIVLTMSLVHSLAWALIIHWCRTCNERNWSRSALSTHTAKRLREESSLVRLALTLPMWTGLVMVICVLLLLPFSNGRVRRACFPTFASVHRAVLIPFIVILSVSSRAS
jgi:respiratory burst oxidase